jgi:Phytanoyl-CoA dioxygenase (PhyH)
VELSRQQLEFYRLNGYLVVQDVFRDAEVSLLKSEVNGAIQEDSPARVTEEDNRFVRSVYGLHSSNPVFRCLALHPRLVDPARQIIAAPIYVYQFKINVKAAIGGERWDWHQDFIFWNKEDGMKDPLPVSAAVFLDDVTDHNGPMLLVPGSQRSGMIECAPQMSSSPNSYVDKPAWISNLVASLKYSVNVQTLRCLTDANGIVAATGSRGSVLFFDCNLVHASGSNMMPYERTLALVTYNSTANIPSQSRQKRPEFLVSTNTEPIEAVADDSLLACAGELRKPNHIGQSAAG